MNKKIIVLFIAFIAVAICLSTVSLVVASRKAAVRETVKEELDVQYVLYVGTNDKDTNEPVCEPEEAIEKAKSILIGLFGGYTIQEARGGWINDDGSICQEYTIVIYLSDTTSEQVHAACDVLIKEFNQNSILIQENQTRTEFYSGN